MGGFSLWLRPTSTISEQLQTCISRLCSIYNEKTFISHVTLAGEFEGNLDELKKKSRQIAEVCQTQLVIPIKKVDCGTTRFQCIYLVCEQIPKLIEIGNMSRSIFGVGQNQVYFPHLSLLYSKSLSQEIRNEIIESDEAKNIFDIVKEDGILMSTIELWDTHSDDEEEWFLVSSYSLSTE
jgi:hypothetical protein